MNDEVPSGSIPDDGRIQRSATVQTILAVALLIFVAVFSFLCVNIIGTLFDTSQATYWMIELIFALLCGGAGAIVGGSADVRTTLNIPGSPVQAKLGGAVAMVVVGFIVAYLGSPTPEDQSYVLEIHDVPPFQYVNDVPYNVYVGALDKDQTTTSPSENGATLRIPHAGKYRLLIAIYTKTSNTTKTYARCTLTFENVTEPGSSAMQVVPGPDLRFRLYLSSTYIDKAVKASISFNKLVEDQPCIEGAIATERTEALGNYFKLAPIGVGVRLS